MRQVVLGLSLIFAAGALSACGEDPPCGVDDQGDEVPVCVYDATGDLYCPLDNWIADDDCNTCGCSAEGEVKCNDRAECATETTPGTSLPE